MIRAFDAAQRTLVPVRSPPPTGWSHVAEPTAAELAALRELGVPDDLLRHALDLDEVARIDRDDHGATTLVVLRVPWHQGPAHDLPYRAAPLAVILQKDRLLTIARHETGAVDELLAREDLAPERHHRFVLQLLLCTAERFLGHVRDIDRETERLEDELQASLRNREVLGLLKYQKGLVHLTTALASNQIMLERLQKDPRFQISPEDHELLEDVFVELHQAIEMTKISGNILSQMMDAFASIISNNLNVVMKVLTALTIVLTFPVILASLYGMNVALPFQHHPGAFLGILVASLLASTGVAVFFWQKRWL